MTEAVGFDEAERLLTEAEFEECTHLWYSSNYVYVARMCGPGGEEFAAVYKPAKGETPLWDFPDGTLHLREVAAYRLAKLAGWPFIPPTILREGPHGVGSLQLFVEHDRTSHFFEQRENPALVPQLQRMAVFDYVANNADRKGGHCLLDAEGRIWGIDHGLCFHSQYKLRTVMWDWSEQPIPADLAAGLERLQGLVAPGEEQAAPVFELIHEQEARALRDRIGKLLAAKRFPPPGPHRCYPWPLV
jgi:uncharacterized repeat protein (TIGR03843 family)